MKKSVVFNNQFAPKLGGQFELESGGQFTPELVVNLHWKVVVNLTGFSSFDDIIGNKQIPIISNLSESTSTASQQLASNPIFDGLDSHLLAVIASTKQGRTIRDNAIALDLTVNDPFSSLPPTGVKLVRGDAGNSKIPLTQNLTIEVIHPNQQRLIELQKQWDIDLKKYFQQGDSSIIITALTDKSPFNLSSIVCLIEKDGKKILLTGDSRSDDIYQGLVEHHLLDSNGKMHVDILKMPHHGSKANMTVEFLQKITADHYVISADGKHSNPDQEVLNMFLQNVKSGTLHLTNQKGKLKLEEKLTQFLSDLDKSNSQLKVSFPNASSNSSIINLLNPINY